MKTSIILLFTFFNLILYAQEDQSSQIKRIEPPFWWIGMQHTELQIMLYGENIAGSTPTITYKGLEILEIRRVSNPNYLFIYLNINPQTQPGEFDINLKGTNSSEIIKYTLKQREAGSQNRKGFSNADVLYLLMPDRFSNGDPTNDNVKGMLESADRTNPDGRHGGDIKGISDHLDYLAGLGVTGLWINPLVENNNPKFSYHGYAITDFYNIDPRFGTNKDYVNLVNKCHSKNLKVVMDMIFNHCSINHWIIKDLPGQSWIHQYENFTKSNFRASTIMDPHASDFDLELMLTGWFDEQMADLDQRNELLATYLIQNSIWWIEFAGIDGIRIDTQPYPYKEFITLWGKRIFDEYPNFNVVGETWLQKESLIAYFQANEDPDAEYNSNIPCVTDFPMYFALNNAFKEKDSWTDGLARIYYVLAQDFLYPHAEKNMIFCDNHDLTRYFTSVGNNFDQWKMGISTLLTNRGIPTIYYGTEILMTGKESDGHGQIRKDFPGGWPGDARNAFTAEGRTPQENQAFKYLQTLLKWRKKQAAAQHGLLKQYVPQDDVYVYFRYLDKQSVMIILNNSRNELKAIDNNRFSESLNGFSYGKNVITGQTVNYFDSFTIPPKSSLIIDLFK